MAELISTWAPRALPLLLPFTVLAVGWLLYQSVPQQDSFSLNPTLFDVDWDAENPSPEQVRRAIEVRLAWATSQLILATLMVLGIGAAVYVSFRFIPPIIPAVFTIISGAIGLYLFLTDEGESFALTFAVQLFERIDTLETSWFGSGVYGWTKWSSATDGLAIPLLFLTPLAFSALLWGLYSAGEDEGPERVAQRANQLRQRRRLATLLLYSSAAVLISFVLELHALLRWPVVAAGPDPAPFLVVATGITAWAGVLFTMFLIGMVAPVFTVLSSRVENLAIGSGGATLSDLPEWLRNNGMAGSGWRRVFEILAMLGPSAVGVAGLPIVEAILAALGGS